MKHLQAAYLAWGSGGCLQPVAARPALTSAKVQINIEKCCNGLGVEVDWSWSRLTDFFFTIVGVVGLLCLRLFNII